MSVMITNPRWLACNRAHGRETTSFEFTTWNRARWLEFEAEVAPRGAKKNHGGARDRLVLGGMLDVDARYDAWLLARYPEAK